MNILPQITANLDQMFLFQVPYLIAILKKFVANLLRNIANLLSQLKTPHFLLEVNVTMHVSVAVLDK